MDNLSSAYPKGVNFVPADDEEELRRRGGEGCKISALGNITKCQSNRSTSDFQEVRIKRLAKFCLQEIAGKLLPNERVNHCLRHRISKDSGVKVMFNPVREKAHYGNVVRCGSVWTCPVCSAQISEKRRLELKLGVQNWRNKGGSVYLLTLTNRHHAGDNLKQLLDGQKKALAYLWGNRKPKEMLKKLGKEGHIIATEVTYGESGWHPHFHILLFMKHEVNIQGLRSFLAIEWQNCCKKAGLALPSLEHGVDLQDGSFADQYVSKWGLEEEMTRGHTKKGKEGGLTPFDLLRQSVEIVEYGKLFQVFAKAFKGKRQLHWTRGLKALLGIAERTDEELAEETEKEAYQYKELELVLWSLIAKYKHRGEYLEAVEDDIKYGGNRANALIMKLANYEYQRLKENADTA